MSLSCPALDAFLQPGAQLLFVAPHPDDEALAAAGLMQLAHARGMRVRIWQLSDGDNNPWPQRWLERRIRINASARQRWGARRCAETRAGLARIGLPDSTVERWCWPDLGFNEGLHRRLPFLLDALTQELQALRPDVLVIPGLDDRHPDHGAAHVLLQLALYRAHMQPTCLDYVLHGRADASDPVRVELDATAQQAKRAAILEHRSQTALSRGRMLAAVREYECFGRCEADAGPGAVAGLPWDPPFALRSMLHLSVAWPGGSRRWRWRNAPLRRTPQGWALDVPAQAADGGPVYARLHVTCPSPWIFDHWGWAQLTPARG